MLRSFDPNLGAIDVSQPEAEKLQVPDPYGEGISSFENVLKMIESACLGLIKYFATKNY
jgi:protein-tyrosine-phosphatase